MSSEPYGNLYVRCIKDAIFDSSFDACRAVFESVSKGSGNNSCQSQLDAYVACMERNKGRAPDPFEPEYCAEERELYRVCRQDLRKK